MAFATSQVKVESTGSHWRTTGKWTGSIGDAAGTISVPGMEVTEMQFNPNLSSGGPAERPLASWTAASGIATVTVYNHIAVSNGRFTIISR